MCCILINEDAEGAEGKSDTADSADGKKEDSKE